MDQIFNFIGLLLITIGGLIAAKATPAPQYNSEGSVGLANSPEKGERITTHYMQKNLSGSLALIGIGALFQTIALIISWFK